ISKMEDFNFWPRFEARAWLRWTGQPLPPRETIGGGQKSADVKRLLVAPPPFYESSSSVKGERTVAAPVNLPFFYPSIGVSLAPVGCFEVALAAPSPNEPKGPGGCRARQYQHGITVAGSFLSFRGSGEPSYCAGPTATANSPEGVFIS